MRRRGRKKGTKLIGIVSHSVSSCEKTMLKGDAFSTMQRRQGAFIIGKNSPLQASTDLLSAFADHPSRCISIEPATENICTMHPANLAHNYTRPILAQELFISGLGEMSRQGRTDITMRKRLFRRRSRTRLKSCSDEFHLNLNSLI